MFSLKSILGYFADASWLCTLVVDFYLSEYSIFVLSRAAFPLLVQFSGHFPHQLYPKQLSHSAIQIHFAWKALKMHEKLLLYPAAL